MLRLITRVRTGRFPYEGEQGTGRRNASAQHAFGRGVSVAIAIAMVVMLAVACSPSHPIETTAAGATIPTAESPMTSLGPTNSSPIETAATEDDPIYGYGDYSAYSYSNVPWDLVTAAMIACMRDQGWPIEPIGNNGISFAPVPAEQNQAARIDHDRCLAGLNLPEYGATQAIDIERVYSFWVDILKPCYEAEGYHIPDPPSLEAFVESYPNVDWAPWRYVPDPSPGLDQRCPASPYDHDLAGDR